MDNQALRAVFLDEATVNQQDLQLEKLKANFSHWEVYSFTSPEQRLERLQNVDVAITNKVVLDKETIAQCPKLKLILVAATGVNNVDLKAASERNIIVCNCQAYGVDSVAQHTIMLILAMLSHFCDYQKDMQNNAWAKSGSFCLQNYPIEEVRGKKLGIIGYGVIGQAVAALAQAFGMQVLIGQLPGRPHRPHALELNQLLPQVDIVSLHCPLTELSYHLMNDKTFGLMKQGSYLVNVARGDVVNETALANALCSGKLAGAAVDVLSEEPPSLQHPLLDSKIPNLIITPHHAWTGKQARQNIIQQMAENAHAFLMGKPIRVVN